MGEVHDGYAEVMVKSTRDGTIKMITTPPPTQPNTKKHPHGRRTTDGRRYERRPNKEDKKQPQPDERNKEHRQIYVYRLHRRLRYSLFVDTIFHYSSHFFFFFFIFLHLDIK
jgi:hypothetical protein